MSTFLFNIRLRLYAQCFSHCPLFRLCESVVNWHDLHYLLGSIQHVSVSVGFQSFLHLVHYGLCFVLTESCCYYLLWQRSAKRSPNRIPTDCIPTEQAKTYRHRSSLCSSEFALRSWLYIFLHKLVAAPLTWLQGNAAEKVAVFTFTRSALGAVSAGTEAMLYRCILLKRALLYGSKNCAHHLQSCGTAWLLMRYVSLHESSCMIHCKLMHFAFQFYNTQYVRQGRGYS